MYSAFIAHFRHKIRVVSNTLFLSSSSFSTFFFIKIKIQTVYACTENILWHLDITALVPQFIVLNMSVIIPNGGPFAFTKVQNFKKKGKFKHISCGNGCGVVIYSKKRICSLNGSPILLASNHQKMK